MVKNMTIKKQLELIEKEMSCKTVFDAINDLVKEYCYMTQVYKSDDNPLTYVVVYVFNDLNRIRLEIIKRDNVVNYKIGLFCNSFEITEKTEKYIEKTEEFEGIRTELLLFLKEKGKVFLDSLEDNKHYNYAVKYLFDLAVNKKMNGLYTGNVKIKYMNGAYLIYKEVCLNDNIGYKNMYCIVGCRDKLKIINSLVIDSKGNLDKLYERVVYYDSALDLKKAWKAMKYVVYESIEEKEISKKFS